MFSLAYTHSALNCLDEAEGRVVRAERIIEELATIVTSYASNQRAAADAAVATAVFAVTNAESAAANAESALKRAQEFIKDWWVFLFSFSAIICLTCCYIATSQKK